MIDWPSFGYGAGAFAFTTYAWWWREDITVWVQRKVVAYHRRRAVLRFHRAVTAKVLHELHAEVDRLQVEAANERLGHEAAEREIAALREQLKAAKAMDERWIAYQGRKKLARREGTFWTQR